MSIFGTILHKLGLGSDANPVAAAAQVAAATAAAAAPADTPAAASDAPGDTPAVTPISTVDVVAHLEELAAAHAEPLNWKVSIVDLLKLLDLESSLDFRKHLAAELDCPPDLLEDSARMNMWLHKTVLQKLADNGGNIPADLLA